MGPKRSLLPGSPNAAANHLKAADMPGNRPEALILLGKTGKTPGENELVGVAGFEPATPASRTQCSTGLSHTPTRTRLIALGFAHRKQPNLRI